MADDGARTLLAGATLGTTRHVCAFFNDEEEEYRVLMPFIREGFQCGDKAIHVVNPDRVDAHVSRLATAGIDAAAAQQRGQLDLRRNTETYLRDGQFDQDRMLRAFGQLAGRAPDHGFHRHRIVCRMDWAAHRQGVVGSVIEFEARVDEVWRRHDDIVICTYDPGQFSGDAVVDIMRTHAMVIVGGVLHRNPFFVPPDQFLSTFRARRGK